MTYVNFEQSWDSNTLSVSGHAGFSTEGNDIVCAGVSAVTYALLGWLENNRDSGIFVSSDVQSGEVLIQAGRTKEADTAFEVALIGLLQIAQSYPDHVAVSYPNRG